MRKNRYKSFLACLCLLGIVASCKKDFLERPPMDTIVDANYYQTNEQVLAGTAPLYNIVWFSYNDKASHGIGDGRGGVLMSGSYQLENIQMNTTATTGENTSSWRSFFNVIGQSNTAINNINTYAGPAVSESVKQHGIAEARFMRGVAYTYLVQNYGPVPIITNNSTLLQDTTLARSTEASVWEFIVRDIRFAAQNLPTTPVQKGRLTKWAAEGMLAKVFLTKAGLSGTKNQADLDSAKFYAKRVIDNSGASLLPEYEDLFKTANNNNAETLFALQWAYNGNWGSQNSVQAFLAFSSAITGFADGWGGDIGASMDQLGMYDPNYVSGSTGPVIIDAAGDKRRKASFMLPGDRYSYVHQQVNDPSNPGKTLIQELEVPLNTNANNARYNTRAWVKKYVVGRPEDNGGRVLQQRTEINTYMLRLADVYLIYAEAALGTAASTADPLALQYYNAVRTRAGVPTVSTITWDDIFNERRREFAMEGQTWYDIVRLSYYNQAKAFQILSNQDRGDYRVVPNAVPNPTSWTVTAATDQSTRPRKYAVSAANFRLPIPASEMSRAPNLAKPPVDYNFDAQ